ncbi:MAG TPA: glycosyl hydrolase family 8 [Streptosporangiaceae bacterium]|nr:glycosyl hydrolase family 8 [Streptosporangiaceae bacterium]
MARPGGATGRRQEAGRRALAGGLGAVLACAVVASAGCGAGTPSGPPKSVPRFLDAYVRPDGRVARPDQGGDTVSEGQAYGLLLAEANGDDSAFRRIWAWTRDHLELRSGLFAYHADAAGRVLSRQPASDADVLIAWALLRYGGQGAAAMHRAGRQVAAAILAHEVTTGPHGMPVLTAGPWATGRPASLDPSYWSLTALQGLARLTGQQEWTRLASSAVSITRTLTRNGRLLPPDWAALSSSGVLRAEPAPDGSQPQTQYGPDAQRTVVWFATSCDAGVRKLAARWWPMLQTANRAHALSLRPDGNVLNGTPAPLALVASAAAAHAAGDDHATTDLLHGATAVQRAHPTYYGGAWDALGSVLLTSRGLGAC